MSSGQDPVLHVCAAAADEAWVNGYLLPALHLERGEFHTRRDDRVGRPTAAEIAEAIERSRFTLMVLSRAFLSDQWSQYAAGLASHLAVTQGRLLFLAREPCDLPLHIDFRVRLECFDGENWDEPIARLRDVIGRPEPTADEEIPCPYPGMSPYGAEERALFFGRDAEIEELHRRLQRRAKGRGCQIVLIGPSGSGKSSLVRAGLLPRLERDAASPARAHFAICQVRAGAHPMAALAGALGQREGQSLSDAIGALLAGREERRALVVVDPLEEIFALAEEEEASAFLAALRGLRGDPRCAVLAVMRADFYPALMASALWPIDTGERFELGPLRDEALRRAIRRPAGEGGVDVEPALVERLAQEASHGVGVLPLLQETLVLLWERRRERGERRLLTLASYEALRRPGEAGAGRSSALQVAVARHADAVLGDLPAGGEHVARRILLRLIHLGAGGPDTRRQQPEAALRVVGEDAGRFDQVLRHLAAGRLVILSGAATARERLVDLAHEMLITGWPRLSAWLRELRDGEQKRRRIEAVVGEWERLGRGRGGLLHREELPEFEAWLATDRADELGGVHGLAGLVEASRAAIRRRRRWLGAAGVALVVFSAAVMVLTVSLMQQRTLTERSVAAAVDTSYKVTFGIEGELQNVAGAAGLRLRLLDQARRLNDQLEALVGPRSDVARSRAQILLQRGDLLREQGKLPEAAALYREAHFYRLARARALPGDPQAQLELALSYRRLGEVHVELGRLSDARAAFQDSLVLAQRVAASDPDRAEWQRQLAASYGWLGEVHVPAGRISEAGAAYRDALAISRRLVLRDPGNSEWQQDRALYSSKLGEIDFALGKLPDALAAFQEAFAVAWKLAAGEPANVQRQLRLAQGYGRLADVYIVSRALPDAVRMLHAAISISQKLGAEYPANSHWQRDLSWYFRRLGDAHVAAGALGEARRAFRESLVLEERLVATDPSNLDWQQGLSMTHSRLGDVAMTSGAFPEALGAYRRAHAIIAKLAAGDPSNTQLQRDLSISHSGIGDVHLATGTLDDALRSYESALAVAEGLAVRDPSNADWQRLMAASDSKIGDVHLRKGAFADALRRFESARSVAKSLVAGDPSNAEWQRELSAYHDRVGDVCLATGAFADAQEAFRASVAIAEALAARDPSSAGAQSDLSISYERLGQIGMATRKFGHALRAFRNVVAIREKLVARDPSNAEWQANLVTAYQELAEVHVATRDFPAAVRAYHLSLPMAERLAAGAPSSTEWQRMLGVSYDGLGEVHVAAGRLSDALGSYQDALGIAERLAAADPADVQPKKDIAWTHVHLGEVMVRLRMPEEARRHAALAAESLSALDRVAGLSRDAELAAIRAALARLERRLRPAR